MNRLCLTLVLIVMEFMELSQRKDHLFSFVSTAIHSSDSAREAVSCKKTVFNGGLWGYFVLCFWFFLKNILPPHPET